MSLVVLHMPTKTLHVKHDFIQSLIYLIYVVYVKTYKSYFNNILLYVVLFVKVSCDMYIHNIFSYFIQLSNGDKSRKGLKMEMKRVPNS